MGMIIMQSIPHLRPKAAHVIYIIYKKCILGMVCNFGFKGEQKMLLYFLS
jgi:hypothetical protein